MTGRSTGGSAYRTHDRAQLRTTVGARRACGQAGQADADAGPVDPRTTSSGSKSSSSWVTGGAGDLADQQVDRRAAHRLDGLAHGGQRRLGAAHEGGVVVADDRDVVRHAEAGAAGGADGAERQRVARAHDAGDARRRSRLPAACRPRASRRCGRRGRRRARGPARAMTHAPRRACARTARGRSAPGPGRSWCAQATPGARSPARSATSSSQETRGKASSSIEALISTAGRLRPVSRS